MMRAPASAREQSSFSIAQSFTAVLLGLLVVCGLGDRLEVGASSVPYDLDVYGALSGELSSPVGAQIIGVELTADRLTLGAELQAQLPTESGFSLSADASVLCLNSTYMVLDEPLMLRATLDSKLSIHPDVLMDVRLDSEVRWGPIDVHCEYQIDRIQSQGFSEFSGIQDHASIGCEVDVVDLLLEENALPQLRMTSFTQLDACESGVLGKQSFKAEFSGTIGSWSDTAEERRTIEGALSLNACVLPTVEAEARMSLTSRGLASRFEGSVKVDVDRTGLQRVMICSEAESEISYTFGAVSLSCQVDWVGWSRDTTEISSIDFGIEMPLDSAGILMSLASRESANKLGGSITLDFSGTELQCLAVRAEGESELSVALGSLAMFLQADWIAWSRDESEDSSIRLGLEARLDPIGSSSTSNTLKNSSGSQLRVSADVRVDPTSIQFEMGGEFTFGWRLLEREAGESATQWQDEPPLERDERVPDHDGSRK